MSWQSIDVKGFLSELEEERKRKYKNVPHTPRKMKNLHWLFCQSCGLVYLNNDISSFAIRMGCEHKKHSGYKRFFK